MDSRIFHIAITKYNALYLVIFILHYLNQSKNLFPMDENFIFTVALKDVALSKRHFYDPPQLDSHYGGGEGA